MGTVLVQIQSKWITFTGFALKQGSQTMVCVLLIVNKQFNGLSKNCHFRCCSTAIDSGV